MRPRARCAVVLAALLLLPVSCAPLDNGLGGDPCLLQQYQNRSFSSIGRMQSAVTTLSDHIDALQPPTRHGKSEPPDISGALTTIGEFDLAVSTEGNRLRMGAQPPEGRDFQRKVALAMNDLHTAAALLTQVYTDEQNGSDVAATAVAASARQHVQQGSLALARAAVSLAALPVYSPNC